MIGSVTRLSSGVSQVILLAAALAVDAHDVAVVHQSVHGCHGHGAAGEDLVPFPEWLVGGHQQGFALVAVVDQLKQRQGLQLASAPLGDVVNNQQGVAIQLLDQGRQLVAGFGLQRLDKLDQQTPLLFFLERGIGTQLHAHLLIPKPIAAFDDINALSNDWKGHITSHAKCISRQRPPHIREISDETLAYSYLTKETCIDHLSLDVMASNFPSASSGKTEASK